MATSLILASQQVTIYLNLGNLFAGVIGGILNIAVFLSLKTFRESTCAFYLIVISFFNMGQLLTGALSRVLITGFSIDWTSTSIFYCKFRIYLIQVWGLISLSLLSLATIDQYLATCSRPRWQKWSNIKTVRLANLCTILLCLVYSSLYLVFYDVRVSPLTNRVTCMSSNTIFDQYQTNFHRFVMLGFLPNSITGVFGVLAYTNVKNLAYRTVPLVRREHDKQLTVMLLVQAAFNICVLLFYNILSLIAPYIVSSRDPVVIARVDFAQIVSYCFYYAYFAVSITEELTTLLIA